MKKILLYVVLFLFIAGLAMLAYGFWNAKNIRIWVAKAEEIKVRHDISDKEKNITTMFEASGGKKIDDLKNGLAGFTAELEKIKNDSDAAKQETEDLSSPRAAKPVRTELIEFYSQNGKQVEDLKNVANFMSQLFEIAIIFDNIKQDTKLPEIQAMIAEAKKRSAEIDAGILPEEVKISGFNLKTATDNYLDALDQYAKGNIENHDQLDMTYSDFSLMQNSFWDARKNLEIYKNSQNLDDLENKINNDLTVLSRVRFSVK